MVDCEDNEKKVKIRKTAARENGMGEEGRVTKGKNPATDVVLKGEGTQQKL